MKLFYKNTFTFVTIIGEINYSENLDTFRKVYSEYNRIKECKATKLFKIELDNQNTCLLGKDTSKKECIGYIRHQKEFVIIIFTDAFDVSYIKEKFRSHGIFKNTPIAKEWFKLAMKYL